MNNDLTDRFTLDTRPKCASPYCRTRVTYRTEFCADCRSVQREMSATLRRQKTNEDILTRNVERWMRS